VGYWPADVAAKFQDTPRGDSGCRKAGADHTRIDDSCLVQGKAGEYSSIEAPEQLDKGLGVQGIRYIQVDRTQPANHTLEEQDSRNELENQV